MLSGIQLDRTLPHTKEWELYHNSFSLSSKKLRVSLSELAIDYESHHVDLIETGSYENIGAAYRKVNPQGLVPVLVHEGHPIYESHEEMVYAAEHAGEGAADLLPEDPAVRAEVERWTDCASLVDDPMRGTAERAPAGRRGRRRRRRAGAAAGTSGAPVPARRHPGAGRVGARGDPVRAGSRHRHGAGRPGPSCGRSGAASQQRAADGTRGQAMIDMNWIALIVAALSAFVLGALWYSNPLFGKVWGREVGVDPQTGGHPARVFCTVRRHSWRLAKLAEATRRPLSQAWIGALRSATSSTRCATSCR